MFLLSCGWDGGGYYRAACGTGPIPTETQSPCRTPVACLVQYTHTGHLLTEGAPSSFKPHPLSCSEPSLAGGGGGGVCHLEPSVLQDRGGEAVSSDGSAMREAWDVTTVAGVVRGVGLSESESHVHVPGDRGGGRGWGCGRCDGLVECSMHLSRQIMYGSPSLLMRNSGRLQCLTYTRTNP